MYAISPLDGLAAGIVPTITRGRAPAAPNEIALGSRSMADAGIDVGDPVELTYLDTPHRLTVVGEAVINDGHEPIPGLGAIVTPQWLTSVDQASYVSDFAVRFSPEARRDGVAAVEREFTGWTTRPVAPHGVVNLERISGWPAVLAVLMATIAVVAFLHALLLTVRTQRRQLAVLRALGSSRRQLAGAVVWHAVFLTVPAVAVGVPLGVVLGRAGWGVFARNLGVGSAPIVPPASLVLAAVVTLALAAVLAVGRAGARRGSARRRRCGPSDGAPLRRRPDAAGGADPTAAARPDDGPRPTACGRRALGAGAGPRWPCSGAPSRARRAARPARRARRPG